MLLLRSGLAGELIDVVRRRQLILHRADPFDLPSRYAALYLFTIGHNRRVVSVASGPHPAGQLVVLQYTHKLGASQRWARVAWTLAVLEGATPRPGALLGVGIQPIAAGPFSRYRQAPLEGAPEPMARWKAFCESARTLRNWLDKGLVGFLGRQDPLTTWELRGGLVAGYRPGPVSAPEVDHLLDAVVWLHDLTDRRGA